jgi:hypothetical protein
MPPTDPWGRCKAIEIEPVIAAPARNRPAFAMRAARGRRGSPVLRRGTLFRVENYQERRARIEAEVCADHTKLAKHTALTESSRAQTIDLQTMQRKSNFQFSLPVVLPI